MALGLGDDAPDFLLFDQEGYSHTLREHRGQFVLLFFYPRDFVFHSTKLAKLFETKYTDIKRKNVVVYGVSNDFVKTHAEFHKSLQLTYDLLSDPEGEIIKKYEASGFLGPRFVSYLIGPDGRVFRRYDDNYSINHPNLALADLH